MFQVTTFKCPPLSDVVNTPKQFECGDKEVSPRFRVQVHEIEPHVMVGGESSSCALFEREDRSVVTQDEPESILRVFQEVVVSDFEQLRRDGWERVEGHAVRASAVA